MFCVKDHVIEIREKIGRGNLSTCEGARFCQTKHKPARRLVAGATHVLVVDIAVQKNVLKQVAVCVGGHLPPVLRIAERGALGAVCCYALLFPAHEAALIHGVAGELEVVIDFVVQNMLRACGCLVSREIDHE